MLTYNFFNFNNILHSTLHDVLTYKVNIIKYTHFEPYNNNKKGVNIHFFAQVIHLINNKTYNMN